MVQSVAASILADHQTLTIHHLQETDGAQILLFIAMETKKRHFIQWTLDVMSLSSSLMTCV